MSFMPCCTDIYTQWKSAAHCRKKYGYAEPGKSGAWIPQAYGDKLVCYELNEMMKIWLEKNNAKDKSVLEVLTEDPKYQKKYKRYVGKAKAFLSHAQLEWKRGGGRSRCRGLPLGRGELADQRAPRHRPGEGCVHALHHCEHGRHVLHRRRWYCRRVPDVSM